MKIEFVGVSVSSLLLTLTASIPNAAANSIASSNRVISSFTIAALIQWFEPQQTAKIVNPKALNQLFLEEPVTPIQVELLRRSIPSAHDL